MYDGPRTVVAWDEQPLEAVRKDETLVDGMVRGVTASLRFVTRERLVLPSVVFKSRVRDGVLDVSVTGMVAP